MVGKIPSEIEPERLSSSSRTTSRICSDWMRIRAAWSRIRRPTSVGMIGWWLRSKIFTPSSSSSFWIIVLRVGWVTLQ